MCYTSFFTPVTDTLRETNIRKSMGCKIWDGLFSGAKLLVSGRVFQRSEISPLQMAEHNLGFVGVII